MNPIAQIQTILKDAGFYTGAIDSIWGTKSETALRALLAQKRSGRGSWFSQYEGTYSWVDNGDRPGSNALGVSDENQGIALYDKSTLGHWFLVTAPNGITLKLQQTDIGPHPSTGRQIDIAAVAAERFGYRPTNFPTDGIFTWLPA